ncbi:protein tumorous imaginal discs, mitochondrial [Copidosoma floridanum]|uniref:protein tumorous imaginal discs, mitochondrial n=1 Tax=Copidosoma floridanum TaxID=29053 RepID=UPI0006C9BFE6|nr:protein tumorous imaginal discs, mitochondrial [Copidosoma floridanum]
MNRPKPHFISSFKEIKAYMSTRRRVQNHYDTLKVAKESTQEEIKTAYYELTKKYHPDRNTSQEAKTKFQDVSNAYEVLGNFHKRKVYDRNLSARGGTVASNTSYPVHEDKFAGFKKSRSSNVNETKSTDNFRNYDFDAWTKAHYGVAFKRHLDRKRAQEVVKDLDDRVQRYNEAEYQNSLRLTIFFCFTIVISVLMQTFFERNYDEPRVKQRIANNNEIQEVNFRKN